MSAASEPSGRPPTGELLALLARWLLAGVFIAMGLSKALQPVEFLKLVRQYGFTDVPLLLNGVAVVLPWLELVCGVLLLAGVAVRGTAALLAVMLVAFSGLILSRALEIGATSALPFCAIKFDCGCGAGEVLICRKLAENALLAGLATWLMFTRRRRFSLWHSVVAPR